MNALLSIKPKYVKKIIEGTKKYEFRKAIFKNNVKKVWIYESAPTKKIIGEFYVGIILSDSPEGLWEKLQDESGISEEEFFCYFDGKGKGYALEIKKFKLYKKKINPQETIPDFHPPQSFCYMNYIPGPLLQ